MVEQRLHLWPQSFCEIVFDMPKDLPKVPTNDEPSSFEFPEILGQHLLRRGWHFPRELPKPYRAFSDGAKDVYLPLPLEKTNRFSTRAAVIL
jgi:hypothetical protein